MKRLLIAFALLTPLSVNAASFDCQKRRLRMKGYLRAPDAE